MTTRPAAVIDRVTLVVSDLDRTEEDYIKTFGAESSNAATSILR
jgi:hypothetical protein